MSGQKLFSDKDIYKACEKLLDNIIEVTREFPRAYKYSVGGRLIEISVDLVAESAAAYMKRDLDVRIQHLLSFQAKFETLKLLTKMAGKKQWIKGLNKHANIIELTESIGRQSTAWKNSLLAMEKKRKENEGKNRI